MPRPTGAPALERRVPSTRARASVGTTSVVLARRHRSRVPGKEGTVERSETRGGTTDGEFGQPEPIAILDSMGVGTPFAGQNVGVAMMRQLEMNLSGLGIERLQTQIEWDQIDLLKFFQKSGFKPAARLCLEKAVRRPGG